MAWTKEKQAAYTKEWRQRNREKMRTYQAEWSHRNADHIRELRRQWQRENKSRVRASQKKFHDLHPDAQREYHRRYFQKSATAMEKKRLRYRRWYYKNQEREIARSIKWCKDHPEQTLASAKAAVHRRRQRIKQAGGAFTGRDWMWLLQVCGYRCQCCRRKEPEIKLEPDHIVALANHGTNDLSNIQPLCSKCNRAKRVTTKDFRRKGVVAAVLKRQECKSKPEVQLTLPL